MCLVGNAKGWQGHCSPLLMRAPPAAQIECILELQSDLGSFLLGLTYVIFVEALSGFSFPSHMACCFHGHTSCWGG